VLRRDAERRETSHFLFARSIFHNQVVALSCGAERDAALRDGVLQNAAEQRAAADQSIVALRSVEMWCGAER
jgi:hypothetical protein